MGCFNDLPKDVKWLVFAHVLNESSTFYTLSTTHKGWKHFEHGPSVYSFSGRLQEKCTRLAQVSKGCLALFRSKCYKLSLRF